jgi:hypothetical protein
VVVAARAAIPAAIPVETLVATQVVIPEVAVITLAAEVLT